MNANRRIAVLTGDLIGSKKADAHEITKTFQLIETTTREYGDKRGFDPRFTRFRGDGWQVIQPEPGLILDFVLTIVSRLRASQESIETRIAVGVGEYTTLGTRDLSDASGDAFFLSGRAIERMSPKRQLYITGDGIGPSEEALGHLCSFIANSWTSTQATAVALALDPSRPKHHEIAEKLAITRQAVQSRLSGAGYPEIEAAVQAFMLNEFNIDKEGKVL